MKTWYSSRTLWVNAIAIVAIIAQAITGNELINAEGQVAILAIVNVLLRAITGKPIKWGK